jgi:cystathionine gamma-synthase
MNNRGMQRLRQLSPDTVTVKAGRPAHEPDAPLSPPVVLASTYVAGGDLEYGRYGNPTWAAFEETLGALEGGRALSFASGLAAVAALLESVPDGGVVVAPRHAYLGTLAQLAGMEKRHGVEVRQVDVADTDVVVAATAGADVLWLESPTNPAVEVADLPVVCAAGRDAGALVVVDNTFATPFVQRPLEMGAGVVLHSATKFLAGHSDVVLGAVVMRDDATYDALDRHRREKGAVPGPFEAWLALRGLRTLHLRIQRAQANAAVLAERLNGYPGLERVRYPGLIGDPGHARATAQMRGYGAIISIEVRGADAADAFCAATRLWVTATSLGGVESTLERRRRWAGEAPTIPEGLVRLSVGIEDVEDLWADLEQALAVL